MLKLLFLGSPLIEKDGKPVYLQRRKTLALLVYLAMAGEHHHRNTLATMLWPNHSQKESRANLRRELSLLNHALGGACLDCQKDIVSLRARPKIWLDVDQFLNKLAWVESNKENPGVATSTLIGTLVEVVELYRSDFLAGFTLPDCLDFDEWQFYHAESLRQGLGNALELLVKLYDRIKNYFSALHYARRWVSVNHLHEPAHYYLMSLLVKSGHKAAALRQYEVCARILSKELDISPSIEMTDLYQDIRSGKIKVKINPIS
jgi:DNA-binding SARP family transcriptional activator